MSQRHQTILSDDITGEDLESGEGETLEFGLDGVTYEIDVSHENAREIRGTIGGYAENARRKRRERRATPNAKTSGRATPSDEDKAEAKAARAWARAEGHDVGERGRVPNEIIEAYRNRGGQQPTPVREESDDELEAFAG